MFYCSKFLEKQPILRYLQKSASPIMICMSNPKLITLRQVVPACLEVEVKAVQTTKALQHKSIIIIPLKSSEIGFQVIPLWISSI